MNTPLPCPWCGEKPLVHKVDGCVGTTYRVRCANGKCMINCYVAETNRDLAVAWWNNRKEPIVDTVDA